MLYAKMMRLLLSWAALVLISIPCFAQEKAVEKNYLQVGVGVASLQELGVRLGNSFTLFFPVTRRVDRVHGPFQVGYLREVHPKWKVGAISSYTYIRTNYFYYTEEQGEVVNTKGGEDKVEFYTLMPSVEYTWAKSEIVQLYSGLSLGLIVAKTKERSYAENRTRHRSRAGYLGHLNVMGLRVGKLFGGYMEGGLGVHGLVSGGVYGTF